MGEMSLLKDWEADLYLSSKLPMRKLVFVLLS